MILAIRVLNIYSLTSRQPVQQQEIWLSHEGDWRHRELIMSKVKHWVMVSIFEKFQGEKHLVRWWKNSSVAKSIIHYPLPQLTSALFLWAIPALPISKMRKPWIWCNSHSLSIQGCRSANKFCPCYFEPFPQGICHLYTETFWQPLGTGIFSHFNGVHFYCIQYFFHSTSRRWISPLL